MVNLFSVGWSSGGSPGRVFCHAQVIENQTSVAIEPVHFLCDADLAIREKPQYPYGKTAQPGDVLGPKAGANAAAVLVEVPIDHVVAAILEHSNACDWPPAPAVDWLGLMPGLSGPLLVYSDFS